MHVDRRRRAGSPPRCSSQEVLWSKTGILDEIISWSTSRGHIAASLHKLPHPAQPLPYWTARDDRNWLECADVQIAIVKGESKMAFQNSPHLILESLVALPAARREFAASSH